MIGFWSGISQRSITLDASVVPASALDTAAAPLWVDRLYFGLLSYAVLCSGVMLWDIGGKQVTHYVGLLSDTPACLATTILAIAAARWTESAVLRRAWGWLAIALALYLVGTLITVHSWLRDEDPFPGPSDLCFLAFYAAIFVGSVHLIRAVATQVPWTQLFLDATILVIGYGAFFWFLVIRPD